MHTDVPVSDTEEYQSDLGRAISIWSSGRNIPLHLAVRLMEQGYIISALEKRHRRH